MADRLRVVTFSPGGRPIVQMDVNNGTTHALVRDTLKFNAPARQQQWSQAIQRYQGSLLARESHENGTMEAEWYVNGAGVADAAKDNIELLMTQFESVTEGRYIEWRPENSTRSTYFPIRGPAPWDLMYRWIEYQAVKTLHIKGGWTIAPLAEGDRMEIDDPFDVDSSGDYTALTGAVGTWASGAGLSLATTARHYYHSSRGYRYGDAQVTSKYLAGTTISAANDVLSSTLSLDANNYLEARVNNGNLTIVQTDAGTPATVATAATGVTLQPGNRYAVVLRQEGNLLFAEFWNDQNSEPRPMFAPPVSTSFTLSGASATKYGAGVSLLAGTRNTVGTATGWGLVDFRVEPYVYRNRTLPDQIKMNGAIPGDAPAATTATITHLNGASAPIWGMIAWTQRPSTGNNLVQIGDFELVTTALWSTAGVSNINAASTSMSRVSTASAKYGSTVLQVVLPGSAAAEGANYPIYRTFRKGVTYTATAWVRATTAGPFNMQLRLGDGPNGDFATGAAVGATNGAMQQLTVSWTPTADRTIGYIGATSQSAAAFTFQVDGVTAYEASAGAPTVYASTEGRGGYQPFGIFEAENANILNGFSAITSNAIYLSGRGLEFNMASANTANATFWLDPSLAVADDMYRGDIEIEVWVRALLPSTASSLLLTAYVAPLSGVSVGGGGRYTREYGQAGKSLTGILPTSGSASRFIRAGTLPMSTLTSTQWGLTIDFDWNSGLSTGTLGFDYALLVPVRSRASNATAKSILGGYGQFIQSPSVETAKVIYPNLRGAAYGPPAPAPGFPDTGLGGAPLWLCPGNNDVLVKLSSTIPDDPLLTSATEQVTHTATVKMSPVPRYFINRGS